MRQPYRRRFLHVLGVVWLLLSGCNSNSPESESPNPSPPGTQAAVTGLLVIDRDILTHPDDALGSPPVDWQQDTDGSTFDRALAHADWQVQEVPGLHGSTGPDGRFTIQDLAAGTYTLEVTKTLNGNLLTASIPFVIGDTGETTVLVEFSQGLLRTVTTYHDGSTEVQTIQGAYGNRLVTHDGRLQTLSDGIRTWQDNNGDGRFDHCESTEATLPCALVAITSLEIGGHTPVILGQPTWVYALAHLSDGSAMDVTALATWHTSDPLVAQVDAWGLVTTVGLGTTRFTATLDAFTSAPWTLTVAERPPLVNIYVDNTSCVYTILRESVDPVGSLPPVGAPPRFHTAPTPSASPQQTTSSDRANADAISLDILPVPACTAVVEIGNTLQLSATGEFINPDGSLHVFEDITADVTWQLTSETAGSIVAGRFSAHQAGSTEIRATLDNVTSEPFEVRVVTEPTLIELAIYAFSGQITPLFLEDNAGMTRETVCVDCDVAITVLRQDQLQWFATAFYDTGVWQDVSSAVRWQSRDATVASLDATGLMTATTAGTTDITATFEGLRSASTTVRVVNEATLQSLWILPEGDSRVVEQGGQVFFQASGFYDVGFERQVTEEASWHSSDGNIGGFEAPGVFTGRGAGTVEVWASLDGQQSEPITLEVFATSTLAYCDADHINRGVWSDAFNRVVLESDCHTYTSPGVVALRYSVTELQPNFGIFDPCLDLYVYQGEQRIRTLREEGCGEPFLPATAADFATERLVYQLQAFWDLKADDGTTVPAGSYTIYGRFYLYYDPVVQIDITVQ